MQELESFKKPATNFVTTTNTPISTKMSVATKTNEPQLSAQRNIGVSAASTHGSPNSNAPLPTTEVEPQSRRFVHYDPVVTPGNYKNTRNR